MESLRSRVREAKNRVLAAIADFTAFKTVKTIVLVALGGDLAAGSYESETIIFGGTPALAGSLAFNGTPFATKTFYNTSGVAITFKAVDADAGIALATGHTQAFWSDGTTMRAVTAAIAN